MHYKRFDKDDILGQIGLERARQEELKRQGKFKKTCADNLPHSEALAVLAEEFGEVAREVAEQIATGVLDVKNLRTELIQVAAVCVAWVESLDTDWNTDV